MIKMKIQSTNEQICNYLKKQISDGTLKQGQQLNLNQIAESIGVSVTPVRDAVNLLIYEGFIDKIGNRMFIHKIPEDERAMLEESIVAQICSGYDICIAKGKRDILVEELENILAIQQNPDHINQDKDEMTFDVVFVRCTDNKFLYQNIVKDYEYYDDLMYIAYQINREKQKEKSLKEHKQMIAFIKEGRDREFHELIREHYEDIVADE